MVFFCVFFKKKKILMMLFIFYICFECIKGVTMMKMGPNYASGVVWATILFFSCFF